MRSARSLGRIIGFLLLVQLAGLIVPFILLVPITAGAPENLANAGANSFQLKLAVFLLFANCCLTVGISVLALRVLRQFSEIFGLLLVALSVIMFCMQAVDNVHILAMLSLSKQFANAPGQGEFYHMLAATVGSIRRWAHFTEIISIDGWILFFYTALYRFRMVPRLLAVLGLITVLLHFVGIIVPVWLGIPVVTPMGAAMGVGHLAIGLWLVFRGFGDRVTKGAVGANTD